MAANKSLQLARSLRSVATRIPAEDVKSAAKEITACLSNILTAVNGPLQQRTTVLDLDFSRANSLPEDYDTDLESAWSNPSREECFTMMSTDASPYSQRSIC